MNQARLTYLFEAYFKKTATPAERDELMQLLEQPEHDEQLKALLTQTWEQHTSLHQPFNDTEGEAMLAAILQEGKDHTAIIKKPQPAIPWLRRAVAAAAILLLVCSVGYWWLNNQSKHTVQISNKIRPLTDTIVPGGNKAVLTLADGSHIVLDSTHQGTLTHQGNVKVINLNTSVLTYNNGTGHSDEVVYNTLSTPPGGQYQLRLADGTKVWLNASSSIRFPVAFTGNARNVSITGEAYFEVAKNAAMPFTVTAKETHVQVLGTHFNIMAYDNEKSVNTTLLEGSVKVSHNNDLLMLTPGQQSIITSSGPIKTREADVEEVMAWKNGWFNFNGSDIEKIMRQVARWYDVEVEYEGSVSTAHFTGIVSRENNISQVLEIMKAGGIRFTIQGHKVIVHNRI